MSGREVMMVWTQMRKRWQTAFDWKVKIISVWLKEKKDDSDDDGKGKKRSKDSKKKNKKKDEADDEAFDDSEDDDRQDREV